MQRRTRGSASLRAPESAHQQWGRSPHRTEYWLSVAPPDASIVSPVTNPFRSELRNAAIAAISLAAPARPTGVSSAEMRESTSASERELTRGGRGGHRGSCCSPNCPWRPPRSRLHSPGCHPSRLPVRATWCEANACARAGHDGDPSRYSKIHVVLLKGSVTKGYVRPSQDGRLIAAEAREQERSQDRHWEREECASAD